jgi:fatty-acyl-CoA synthase
MFYSDWLYRRESLSPNKVALIDAENGDLAITYRQWNRQVNRMANFFQQKLGINKGDHISIYSVNRMEYLDAIFACNKLGAILQVINWRLTVGEIEEIISEFEPKILIYGEEWLEQVNQLREKLNPGCKYVCFGDGIAKCDISWKDEAGKWSETQPDPVELDWEDPWVICYTGGTTGLPKGAILNYQSLTWNSINTVISWGLQPDDVVPHYMPMFHTGGINVMMQPIVYIGGTTILCKGFDVNQIFDQIERLGITFFFGVPVMLLAMIQNPRWESLDLSKVRLVMAGGGNCPKVVYEAFWKKGVEFKEGYGLTEAGPNTFWLPKELAKEKFGSVGRPLFHVDVKIVGESGNLLGSNQVGELMVRGPHVFGGYWKNPIATEAVLDQGWLHTGDLAKVDEDGCHYIVGRLKDMIKSGGENIYPSEIEDILHSHPEILEAAVIPMPDPKWGEVGCAVVVLRPKSKLNDDGLIQWMKGRMAHYKVPKSVIFLDQLPKTSANKVDKKLLVEKLGKSKNDKQEEKP